MVRRGRHFLQIPGPTNTPDRILRAMAASTIDHRGSDLAAAGVPFRRGGVDAALALLSSRALVETRPSAAGEHWRAFGQE